MNARDGILIAGGCGHVGRRIAAEFAPEYPGRVIVAGRDAGKALTLAEALGNGVRAVRLDIDDRASGDAALAVVSLVINCTLCASASRTFCGL